MSPLDLATIDAHTAGEPLRVVTSGYPELPGETMLAKRRHAREHTDHVRRLLMLEPRGHADMYGAVPTEPVTPDGHVGVLFMHNEGWSTMCGHGIVALVKVGLEEGLFASDSGTVRIDTPAGRVTAYAELEGDTVERVRFENVPSFVLHRDAALEVDGLGTLRVDLAFGGAFYVYVDAHDVELAIAPETCRRAIELGTAVKRAAAEQLELRHPGGPENGDDSGDLVFLYGTIFVEPGSGAAHSRNVCVFADGEVDRSPTGTGVSGRAAIHHARGELALGEWITIESLIGTSFDVRAARETTVGPLAAVVPEVAGRAWVTGRHRFTADPSDPLLGGFLLR